MKIPRVRRPRLSYANIASTLALVLAMSMGGAYAHGKIGSAQLKQNAVKSRHIGWQQVKTPDLGKRSVATNRIKPRAVTRGKLAPNARGARVFQYVAPGAVFDSQDSAVVALPGTWTAVRLAKSSWSVQLVRNESPSLFSLGQTGGFGESDLNGFMILVDGSGVARVHIDAPSYGAIDSIRITRTVVTNSGSASLTRQAQPRASTGD